MIENQPEEVPAYMGKYIGAADPYNMTDDELAQAKDAMFLLKPNVLRLAQQNTDTVSALANGEVWLATANLGTDERRPGQPAARSSRSSRPRKAPSAGWTPR